jgi:hypothetical protein
MLRLMANAAGQAARGLYARPAVLRVADLEMNLVRHIVSGATLELADVLPGQRRPGLPVFLRFPAPRLAEKGTALPTCAQVKG